MVLDLKVPQGAGLADLLPILPVFLIYALSFVYVAISLDVAIRLNRLEASVDDHFPAGAPGDWPDSMARVVTAMGDRFAAAVHPFPVRQCRDAA